jgi:hypothetical protein
MLPLVAWSSSRKMEVLGSVNAVLVGNSLVNVWLHEHFERPVCTVSRNPYGNCAQIAASILGHDEVFELSHLLGGSGDATISSTFAKIMFSPLLINTQGSASMGLKPVMARKRDSSSYQRRSERRKPYSAFRSFVILLSGNYI